jgi:large subunit ribosomal protein L11
MSKETVEIMVDGGKATASAQMAQTLGPMRINIQEVLKSINEKTVDFKGMKVPVKILVDSETKEFEIEIGTPPVSELIKKELGLEKGSGMPNKTKVGNISIEQVIKIAKMKKDSMLVNSLKSAVKNVAGSCNSLGILIESKVSKELNKEIENGVYDKEIKEGKTEVSAEKKQMLQEDLIRIQEELKKELERLAAEEEKEKGETKEEKKEEIVEEKEVKEEGKEVKKEDFKAKPEAKKEFKKEEKKK